MKPLIAVILFLTMTGFFTVKGQDRTVEIEGQTVIVLEGRKTDFSTPRRYIYRNDITPAYLPERYYTGLRFGRGILLYAGRGRTGFRYATKS